MKKFNITFAVILVACLGFTLMSNTNFSKDPQSKTVSDLEDTPPTDTLPEEVHKLVEKELIKPIRACLEKKDPHIFMTKCYSRVTYQVDKRPPMGFGNHDLIKGTLIFTNCSQDHIIADFSYDKDNKELSIRESFRRPKVKPADFTNDYCTFVEENGVPGGA